MVEGATLELGDVEHDRLSKLLAREILNAGEDPEKYEELQSLQICVGTGEYRVPYNEVVVYHLDGSGHAILHEARYEGDEREGAPVTTTMKYVEADLSWKGRSKVITVTGTTMILGHEVEAALLSVERAPVMIVYHDVDDQVVARRPKDIEWRTHFE